jgi:hypothetical protein
MNHFCVRFQSSEIKLFPRADKVIEIVSASNTDVNPALQARQGEVVRR